MKRIVDALVRWARSEGRNPAWRRLSDPYLLAVAEILLQKTKASDVEPVWRELTACLPTPASLAGASDEDVRRIVKGLGLGNQRTQRLKAMARAMVSADITAEILPGLGSYGFGVVRLAMGKDPTLLPVDGNIARVICRYCGLKFQRGEARKKREVRAAVAKLVETRKDAAGKLRALYGLVDLGESVCSPGRPSCAVCPLAKTCAFALGGAGE